MQNQGGDVCNRLKPFYDEIMDKVEENIIIVSYGDTLSIWNAMWLGFDPEKLNQFDLFGMAGGVSFLNQGKDKKRRIRKLSDMSYME
jgi:Fructose-2,6-bisphosphatase